MCGAALPKPRGRTPRIVACSAMVRLMTAEKGRATPTTLGISHWREFSLTCFRMRPAVHDPVSLIPRGQEDRAEDRASCLARSAEMSRECISPDRACLAIAVIDSKANNV